MSNATKTKDVKYYIHSIIALAIMLFARYIPVPYPFTPEGMLVLGVLIGSIYGFVNGNLYWASIAALFVLGTSEIATVGGILVSVMSNGTFMFLVGLFLLVGHLGHVGFARVLALKIVQSKVTKGRPWILTLFLLIAAFLPATVMSVTAVLVISLPILYGICEEVGIEKTDKWAVLTAIGIGAACSFGLGFWPFQVGPAALYGQLEAAGYTGGVPFVQHALFMAIMVVICLGAIILVIRFLKPDVSKLYNYTPPAEKVKFNSDQKFAAFLVCMLLALFIVPQFLPDGSAVRVWLAQFGNFAIVSFLLALGAFLRKDGKPRIDVSIAASKGLVLWPMVVMVGTVLVIADLLTRAEFGFTALIAQQLGPVFGGGNPIFFTLAAMLGALVLTLFVTAPVVYAIMIPMMVPIALAMDFPLMQTILPFVLVSNIGIVLPSGHPLGAVMHGHEWIGGKNVLKYMPIFMAVFFVIALVAGIPLGMLLF